MLAYRLFLQLKPVNHLITLLCYLYTSTDPAPPEVTSKSHNAVSVTWPFVCFCGINPPALIDSVQYILEISEGVDYKPGYFTRFISDVCAVDYRPVCSGVNINSTTVGGLQPARWYHLRLCIEYLGQRFQSESTTIHTSTWVPSPSAAPRVHVLPVRSSFDLQSEAPVRLEMQVTWNPAVANGCKIIKYQCQVQRFDAQGTVIEGTDAQAKREKMKRMPPLASPERDPVANQWTTSPGRNALQIHNSLVLADRSPTRGRSRRSTKPNSPTSRESSQGQLPQLFDHSLQQSSVQGRRYKWEILFENILTSVRTSSPTSEEAEWHIRVRAKNSEGWSDFSPVLKINKLSHPSLFLPPPPMYCYGACYYAEHASEAYLDGSEGSAYRNGSPKSHASVPEYEGSVRNDLFMNHPLQSASSLKHAESSEKPFSTRASHGKPKLERTPTDRSGTGSEKRLLESLNANPTHVVPQRQRTQHVLNFKEGNAWDAPVAGAAMDVVNPGSPKKKDVLPSLHSPKGTSGKFQRKGSRKEEVGISYH